MRFLHELVTLGVFLADVEQADARIRDAEHIARDDRAHGGELRELQRRGLGVRAEIEHVGVAAVARRHRRHDGRAFHRPHGLQHEVRHGRQRAGIAGADHGSGAAFLHQVDGDAHGGILAAANRLARMFGHADHGGRRMHASARARTAAGALASAGSMTRGLPTRISSRAGSATRARSAPGTHSGAPLSPLITSTAIDGMRYERGSSGPARQLFFGLDFGRFFDDALAAIETVRE